MTRLETLTFLAALPLKDIRRRQDIAERSAGLAYQQRNDVAMQRIDQIRNDLGAAVAIKEFGECVRCHAGVAHTHTGNGVN